MQSHIVSHYVLYVFSLCTRTPLLPDGELEHCKELEEAWYERHGIRASEDPRAVFMLSQSASRRCMSSVNEAGDAACPCHTRKTVRAWSPFRKRWLCLPEKAASMFLPTYALPAECAGVPHLDCATTNIRHKDLGEGINASDWLAVQTSIISSFARVDAIAEAASIGLYQTTSHANQPHTLTYASTFVQQCSTRP